MYREYPPDIKLQHLIETYWVADGFVEKPYTEHIMPDGCVDIIFDFNDISGKNFSEVPELVGTITSLLEISYLPGHIQMMGIRFTPGGITAFTKIPVNEITNQNIKLPLAETLFDTDFYHQLPGMEQIQERVNYLNQYMLSRLYNIYPVNRQIQHTVSIIRKNAGQLSIKQLAYESCLCERQLERKFKATIGISPKLFSNVIRFQAACQYIKMNRAENLDSIAHICGYHDHSHMHKEFQRLGRLSPSKLIEQLAESHKTQN